MEQFVAGVYRVSVRKLVEFILRNGDIDNRRMGRDTDAMQEGSRLHRKIQGRMGAEYQAEVALRLEVPCTHFSISVEGRADGIMTKETKEGPQVVIDEIKCMYRNVSLLTEPLLLHKAQAMCYAYIYGVQQELDEVGVQMTYCNIETEEIVRFQEVFPLEELKSWFLRLITEYEKWITFLYNHLQERQQSIQGLAFPFSYRQGQRDMVVSVYRALERNQTLFVQAPTGIGKTMSTIFPAVSLMGQGKCSKIFYLTAKTITGTVAAESFYILRQRGASLLTIQITAKEKLCPLEEAECNPVFCPRAQGHFDRINDAMYWVLTHESDITRQLIEDYAKKFQVCPYELTLDLSEWVDGVICDYNYAFDPVVKLKRYFSDNTDGEYVFLIDEAHNLVDRAREMYSAVLTREELDSILEIMEPKDTRITRSLKACRKDLVHLKRECQEYLVLEFEQIGGLVLHLVRLFGELDEYMQDHPEFDGRKEVLNFYFTVGQFLDVNELLDENYQVYCIQDRGRFSIRQFCMNPGRNLSTCMERSCGTILFSATLLPIRYFKQLLTGQEEDPAIYVPSPFPQERRLLFISSDVSSKYTRRGREEYLRICSYIQNLYRAHPGNYLVFFPSYQFMEEVYEQMMELDFCTSQISYLMQTSGMEEQEREEFLSRFEQEGDVIGFGVLGGIFSEGIDLVGTRLVGSIIVGTGLPQICAEREILKAYYESQGRDGFDYAYRYPGLNKVLQAAGRVIRTVEDRGVIALLDSRFQERRYGMMFPREWEDIQILSEDRVYGRVLEFWENQCKSPPPVI